MRKGYHNWLLRIFYTLTLLLCSRFFAEKSIVEFVVKIN